MARTGRVAKAGPLITSTRRPMARPGHGPWWRVLVLAVGCALAATGPAAAQSIWDDPAFNLLRQATDALNDKNFQRAGELASQAIAQMPNHPLAYYVRGQAAAAQSKWDEAAASFGKTAELYPGSFAAQRDLAASLEHLGKPKESAQAYRAALALRDQEELRLRMALMLADNGEEPAAMTELETLAMRDSKIPATWSTLGRLQYASGEWAKAEKSYARAVALKDDGRNWFNLGVIRVRMKDLPGALTAFEHAAKDPTVKTQANVEASRVREAMSRESGAARQLRTPGQYSVP
jgi:tetratricopeptide (TPR) repeat protein